MPFGYLYRNAFYNAANLLPETPICARQTILFNLRELVLQTALYGWLSQLGVSAFGRLQPVIHLFISSFERLFISESSH
jgi:hypothetical protein